MALSASEQVLLDQNREYLYDYLGPPAYSLAETAFSQSNLSDHELNLLSQTLQEAFGVIRASFLAEAESFPEIPKPLFGILMDASQKISIMLAKLSEVSGWETGIEFASDREGNPYVFTGIYLLSNQKAFFPISPFVAFQKLIISYQSDYGKVPAPVTVWADSDGMYLLTEEMLPELTFQGGAFEVFAFEGWYADETFTTKLTPGDTGYSPGSTSTQIFYAKWNVTKKVLVSELYLRGIADALRQLTGTTDTYTPAAMVTALRSLKGG